MEVMPMNELYHHGIKGMHWGVRRYQNPDGTLTAAGKLHDRMADRQTRREAKKQRLWNAKNSSQLSDEELTNQILRLQKEKQLKDLTAQTVAPGRKKVRQLLERYGEQMATAAVTTGTSILITKRINDKYNPQKTSYERMKEDFDNKSRLAEDDYPVRVKGYRYSKKTHKWVPDPSGDGNKHKP
jgi:poly-D-alanine transfer protein DltD